MAADKNLRKMLRNTAFSMAVVLVLWLLLNGLVHRPLVDDDSSPAPSAGDSSTARQDVVNFLVGFLVGFVLVLLCQLAAAAIFGSPFADDDDDQEEAAGAARKKARYVAIRDDVEAGGKKY